MPNITIRQVEGQEMLDILYRLDNYAFQPTPPFPNREKWEGHVKSWSGTLYYALFEDGEGVAIASCPLMTQNVRGVIFKMGGVAEVSTHPKARRKGYIRQLMRYIYQQLKDQGYPLSCLYPFRESFYERLGYVTFPQSRKAIIKTADLAPLLKQDLGGETIFGSTEEGYDAYFDFTQKLQPNIHGMAVFSESQKEGAVKGNRNWIVKARVDGQIVGILVYSLKGDQMMEYNLVARRFYYSTSQGKYLLLEWIARHIDQATKAEIWLPAYEQPNTWLADISPKLEPVFVAPMGRVLEVPEIEGMETGPGSFCAAISDPDCPWNNGTWQFESQDGRLVISPAQTADCHLTIQGLSALVYGVNDPEDFSLRGWGDPSPALIETLRAMFPPRLPYLHESY
ncbi:MAG: enhanced intracellular survival protein Eis [Anaerolineales bacterium]